MKDINLEDIFSLDLSNSNCSLFDETNATSTPKKKADNNIVVNAIVKSIFIFLVNLNTFFHLYFLKYSQKNLDQK